MARLNRLLLQDAYPDLVAAPSAKRVLRFPADHAGQAGVAVSLPPGAVVSKAALSTQESLRGDRPDDPGGERRERRSGMHVSGDDTAAVSVAVDQALTATGLALPLLGLRAHAGGGGAEGRRPGRAGREGARDCDRGPVLPGAVEWSPCTRPGRARVRPGLDRAPCYRRRGGLARRDRRRAPRRPHAGRQRPSENILPQPTAALQLLSRSGSARTRPRPRSRRGHEVAAAQDGNSQPRPRRGSPAPHGRPPPVPLTFTSTAGGTVTVCPPHVEYEV